MIHDHECRWSSPRIAQCSLRIQGKAIGTSSLALRRRFLLSRSWRRMALTPKRTFRYCRSHRWPLAYQALQTTKYKVSCIGGSASASFENFCVKFRRFYDPNWRQMPDFSLVSLKSTIDRDPQGHRRRSCVGLAKDHSSPLTNPDCALKCNGSYRRASKTDRADEATLSNTTSTTSMRLWTREACA